MILVTGCTGFVGGHLLAALAGAGPVRCLVRDPDRAARLSDAGFTLVRGDVTDASAVEAAFDGDIEAVIHLVGILVEPRGTTFRDVHVAGTRNVVESCLKKGVGRYLHMSALGSRAGARSEYHRTKWEAEELVRASGLVHTIFRPSVIFGPGDMFTNMFARVLRFLPLVMLPGSGKNLFQPVFVKDVAAAIASSVVLPEAENRVFELGGPERLSFDEVVDRVAAVLGKRPPVKVHLPMPLMRAGAAVAETVLPRPPITRDQLLMLEEDNVTERDDLKSVFGIRPTGFTDGMGTYLSGRAAA